MYIRFCGKIDDGDCKYNDQFYNLTQQNECNMINISDNATQSYLKVLYCVSSNGHLSSTIFSACNYIDSAVIHGIMNKYTLTATAVFV